MPSARRKKVIAEMMPVKKWLSLNEAISYLNLGKDTFLKVALKYHLSVSAIGQTKYYRVNELDDLIESNIIIKQLKG